MLFNLISSAAMAPKLNLTAQRRKRLGIVQLHLGGDHFQRHVDQSIASQRIAGITLESRLLKQHRLGLSNVDGFPFRDAASVMPSVHDKSRSNDPVPWRSKIICCPKCQRPQRIPRLTSPRCIQHRFDINASCSDLTLKLDAKAMNLQQEALIMCV